MSFRNFKTKATNYFPVIVAVIVFLAFLGLSLYTLHELIDKDNAPAEISEPNESETIAHWLYTTRSMNDRATAVIIRTELVASDYYEYPVATVMFEDGSYALVKITIRQYAELSVGDAIVVDRVMIQAYEQ